MGRFFLKIKNDLLIENGNERFSKGHGSLQEVIFQYISQKTARKTH